MNKFLKAFFILDLWIALSLITTIIANILITKNQGLFITISVACALVNGVFCSLMSNSFNFGKKKESKKFANLRK